MFIDYCSDLHASIGNKMQPWSKLKNEKSTILIIAGDTTNNDYQRSWRKIKQAAKVYEHVLFVDGNHEHYNSGLTVTELEGYFKAKQRDNIHYLPAAPVIIGDTTFIGVNGWYNWDVSGYLYQEGYFAWKQWSNDSRCIDFPKGLIAPDLAHSHAYSIRQELERHEKIIVVTHTAPSQQLLQWTGNDSWDSLNGSYCNSLMEPLTEDERIKYWIYGHTHLRCHEGKFRNNARGYAGEIKEPWKLQQIEV